MTKPNGTGSIDFEADKEKEFESTDLDALAVHLDSMFELQLQIEVSEKQTKALKDKFNKINSEVIPNILAEQGLKSLKLADGTTVEVNKKYSCTLPKDPEKKAAAYKWLRDQGLGDIIKNEVAVTFGKGEDNKAKQLLDLAVGNGYEPSQREKVEPMTLKALYRERVESGLDMPSDVFHLFVKDETKMKR